MIKKQISILGCGYLGQNILNSKFIKKYHLKAATRRSPLDIDDIEHFHIDIDNEENQKWIHFFTTDTLIIALPPSSSNNYPILANKIKRYIQKKTQIIFISSIGAYAADQGYCTEDTIPLGKQPLVDVERNFSQQFPQVTILRLGGIVSPSRQVWNYLEGRTLEWDEYLHLVDIENCVDAIEEVIKHQISGEVFNIINSQRIFKSVFYSRKCEQPPLYLSKRPHAKNISNLKSIDILGIKYKDF